VVLEAKAENAGKLAATAGSLAEWQMQVAALAVGNPMAALCICIALAGPLLQVLGENSGGFHLFGSSKTGKTTAAALGCSVWGWPDKGGVLRDWRATANAQEIAAEHASDGLLALDEVHQADPREVTGVVYTLFNGAGKDRMTKMSTAQRRRTWRALALSTGEIDIPTVVSRAGETLPVGAQVRLPSIPVGTDPWPELHGRTDRMELFHELHAAMRQNHGHAGRAFVAYLAEARVQRPEEIAVMFEKVRDRLEAQLPPDADPQVREVVRRFALVAAAGELARTAGLLPWMKGEAFRASAAMLARWIEHRGGVEGNGEGQKAIAAARLFLLKHSSSRLAPFKVTAGGVLEEENAGRPVLDRVGWTKIGDDGQRLFLIHPLAWETEICRPAQVDAHQAKLALRNAGMLVHNPGGLTYKVRVPGVPKPVSAVAVQAAILAGLEETEDCIA
jgi:putative DNA primase/helicase